MIVGRSIEEIMGAFSDSDFATARHLSTSRLVPNVDDTISLGMYGAASGALWLGSSQSIAWFR